jgi:hypothetical protein
MGAPGYLAILQIRPELAVPPSGFGPGGAIKRPTMVNRGDGSGRYGAPQIGGWVRETAQVVVLQTLRNHNLWFSVVARFSTAPRLRLSQ